MNTNLNWLKQPAQAMNETARNAAQARQGQLTKPPGALGKLEALAIQLAAMQGREKPQMSDIYISVFAGDHGVAEEGVSLFPQAVTAEMVKNFARGGAAISVLAKQLGAMMEVVNLGTAFDTGELPGVLQCNLGKGTANFTLEAAMTEGQLAAALQAGNDSAARAAKSGATLFIGGEMGIANTTAAAALACALLNLQPQQLAGPGTGLDQTGVQHKATVVARALALHAAHLNDPLETLRRLGGFEIAALTGAFIACAQRGVPVLVDGYITTAAALLAARIQPSVTSWLMYAHRSAEPGHILMLEALQAEPLLQLGMRLGEGSGAAVAVPLLQLACALHSGMATFAEAGVSEKI
ncbi:MAG: nicotinate-nucleotide--dimethylbenzimidazole phosphoribosyltransferase [Gallionellaceae bacterium]|jgi:nicotinate-nucleotide--dimethylbenzimidazole phosphoribosyltransferase|nr:nicotinate-nucleotide--dimethylbenzimidazole phosphoribosyltransferase [Gallionellaceae bacterium]